MMTPEQYRLLSGVGKRIVDHDRETAEMLADKVVPIHVAWTLRNRTQDRGYLTKVAHKTYGRKAKNGPGKSL